MARGARVRDDGPRPGGVDAVTIDRGRQEGEWRMLVVQLVVLVTGCLVAGALVAAHRRDQRGVR